MKFAPKSKSKYKYHLVILCSIGLIFVGACSNQDTNSNDSAASKTENIATTTTQADTTAKTTPTSAEPVTEKKEDKHGRGGQIIESGY